MHMNRKDIYEVLQRNIDLRRRLFVRGFCITNTRVDAEHHPFYGIWDKKTICSSVNIYLHPKTNVFLKELGVNEYIGLIGHSFNPFTKDYCENTILEYLAESDYGSKTFFDRVNELTGTFILFYVNADKIEFLGDAVGLQSVFYYAHDNTFCISSHSNLIGDLFELSEDTYVTKLKEHRWFHLFGNQLPGNISSFKDVYRLVPNHYVSISLSEGLFEKRFYHPHFENKNMDTIKDELIDILKKTMELISLKWENPAISLTGGCDSKTTLACTRELYNKYKFFSYDSQIHEAPDVMAANAICSKLGLNLIKYDIPYEDCFFGNIEDIRKVILWNCGNVCPNNDNDVRKRIFLEDIPDYDVEVKSWASEVGRSRYTRRYNGRRVFGKTPKARKCTTFYKFLFFNRRLIWKTDKVFEEYLLKFFEASKENAIPWQDQFYWEWHWPSRDGVVLTCEQKYSHEITVPYNNRKILELLLSVPEDDRINDTIYTMIRCELEPRIDEAYKPIVDTNHTKKRAICEDFYYIMNNLLP